MKKFFLILGGAIAFGVAGYYYYKYLQQQKAILNYEDQALSELTTAFQYGLTSYTGQENLTWFGNTLTALANLGVSKSTLQAWFNAHLPKGESVSL